MKLLICDVDGVFTDGTKIYDSTGKVIAKRFCDKDFTAIQRFKEAGVDVCWLSADIKINHAIANRRHIDFFNGRDDDGTISKEIKLHTILQEYNVDPCDVVYVGDDFVDLPIIQELLGLGGKAFCPADAVEDLVSYPGVLKLMTKGGHGVVAELYKRTMQ